MRDMLASGILNQNIFSSQNDFYSDKKKMLSATKSGKTVLKAPCPLVKKTEKPQDKKFSNISPKH